MSAPGIVTGSATVSGTSSATLIPTLDVVLTIAELQNQGDTMAFSEFETDSTKLFLYAVNTLLQVINEPPIDSVTDIDNVLEAKIAGDVIVETKKEILSHGWDINTDTNYTLPLEQDGTISIPYNVLHLSSRDGDLIIRNWKLYSKRNKSFRFDSPQVVNIVWDLQFNELPHPIRNFITIRAARKFQARQVGDRVVYSYTQQDEDEARIIASRANADSFRGNDIDRSTFGQNYYIGEI